MSELQNPLFCVPGKRIGAYPGSRRPECESWLSRSRLARGTLISEHRQDLGRAWPGTQRMVSRKSRQTWTIAHERSLRIGREDE